MTVGRWGRLSAVTGAGFAVVLLVALFVAPEPVYPEEQVGGVTATFYVDYDNRLAAQAYLIAVATVLFLWFLGSLRAFLGRAEGTQPRLAPVAVAGGAVTAGLVLLQAALLLALVDLRADEVLGRAQGSVWSARALYYLLNAVSEVVWFPLAVFVAATSIVILQTRALPAGLGWLGALLAVAFVVLAVAPLEGARPVLVVFLLWALALSLLLARWPAPASDEEPGLPP